MKLRGLIDEDFVNYKRPSMFLGSCYCTWKCCTEQNLDLSVCQNNSLARSPIIDYPDSKIYTRYIDNPITSAIVIGGLEPILQFGEVVNLLRLFRKNKCMDDFVIYTGYYPDEIPDKLNELCYYSNVIVKFGRYIPNSSKRFDDVLGIELVSSNQYAIRLHHNEAINGK